MKYDSRLHKRRRRLLHAFGEGVGLNLDAYLASLSAGFRFNMRKTDRHFQESIGPTLGDDVGETIGLALDQRLWGGQTLAQVTDAATELQSTGATALLGSATAASYNTGTGAGTVTRVDGSNQSYVSFAVTANRTYRVDMTAGAESAMLIRDGGPGGTGLLTLSAGQRTVVYIKPGASLIAIAAPPAVTASFTVHSLKHIPGEHARQTGASTLRPVRQAEGAKFDGSDDNWLSGYLAAAGNNFLMARTTVPASLAATQLVAGASGSSANRFFVGINTSGFACGGVGSDSTSTIVGDTDLRGTEADIGITCDGATVRLLVNDAIEYEAAQNSTPTTTIPFRFGAYNNNGTAGSFYAGAVEESLGGTDYLALSRFQQIRRALDAA